MSIIMPLFIMATVIPPILILISFIISSRSNKDREKISPFECGFDPNQSARTPFSTRFFLLAVIFLVFDIEIALLVPLPMSLFSQSMTVINLSASLFLIILILGLTHEWVQGSLEWAN